MTTREKIEWSIIQIHGVDYLQKICFYCIYNPHGRSGVITPKPHNDSQKSLALALVMIGVPRGVHKTFELGVDYVHSVLGRCGRPPTPDPDWQKFIDEVVSLVGE